ncbi:DUF317 domain-containing protein [Streptomyces sp. NPDC059209]|uniref:DUF317 domain-containing protein n=1 Tax=Streptomyces sp. NPDC059209 TaxID=3346769 RepID=UPI0036BE7DB3
MALEPETSAYAAWWRIQAHGDHDHWYATFGGNTPVEILASPTPSSSRSPRRRRRSGRRWPGRAGATNATSTATKPPPIPTTF